MLDVLKGGELQRVSGGFARSSADGWLDLTEFFMPFKGHKEWVVVRVGLM